MADLISGDFITVNGVSSETVGLWVDTPPVPPMARQRVTSWSTGIDMDESAPDDVWENITLNFSAYVFFRGTNFSLAPVYAFLADARTLAFSRFSGRYFKVRQVGQIAPAAQYDGERIKIQLQFVCAPFKYHISNDPVTPSGTIENPGTRYSRPVYAITHSGACKLTVNGEQLQIAAGAASPIYIDAQRMIAHDANGVNQTMHTTGKFPFLQPGINTISTTGTGLSVTGNWRDF